MIMIWNQKEIYFGNSFKKFSNVRELLATNKISYKYKLVNHNRSNRTRTVSFPENTNYSITYYVYVHKKDYDNACSVLRNVK